MLLARALALLLFYMDITLPETIEIVRFMPENKLSKWRTSIDTFTLPESACNQTKSQYVDCGAKLCERVKLSGSRHFRCSCSDQSPTLTYDNSQWICQGKGQVRNQFGCEVNTLFNSEKSNDRLRMLNTTRRRLTKLIHQNCSVNLNNSWYIGCYGEKVLLRENITLFDLEWRKFGKKDNYAYFVKVLNDSSLRGRIINLGINCTAGSYTKGCLLFKLEGTLSCPLPDLYGLQSTTVPTASLSSARKPTASLWSRATLGSTRTLESTAKPGSRKTTPAKPNPGLIKDKQKHGDANSSSSLGLIAGVSASIATIVIVIAVVVLYRRRKSRKGAHASTSEEFKKNGNSEQNVAFQPDAQNDYLPDRTKEPRNSQIGEVYAALDVPEGHNIYGPGNVDEPFYNFLQDPAQDKGEGQRYSCLSLDPAMSQIGEVYAALDVPEGHNIYGPGNVDEPFYNFLQDPAQDKGEGQRYSCLSLDPAMYQTLEKLQVEDQRNAEYSCPTEPMYNVLEGPTPGVRNETESCGAISVNEPFYNTVEKPVSNEGLSSGNNDPVYNTLEDPLYLGFGCAGQNGPIGLQDPVYNVLEGPGADVVEC